MRFSTNLLLYPHIGVCVLVKIYVTGPMKTALNAGVIKINLNT